ncbi:transmembrane protein 128 [Falco cherrug]|uniref:transmembrane protein 128 n=1 Tax=Falco cherrug TaxID=345164 RepID=UPI002479149A|nr:transmembrane protein 128 [Falco cherrug]
MRFMVQLIRNVLVSHCPSAHIIRYSHAPSAPSAVPPAPPTRLPTNRGPGNATTRYGSSRRPRGHRPPAPSAPTHGAAAPHANGRRGRHASRPLASLPERPKMEAGASGDPVPRLRRGVRRGAEPRDPLLPQPPLGGGGAAEESTAVEKKRKPLTRLYIHSAFWILASIAVTYYFDFFKTITETFQANSWWLASGGCLLAACLSVAFYCILYLEWYCGIEDYDAQYPALINITIATFIAAAVCFNIALWPVWSFMTPLLLFIQFMGFVMLVSLLG